MDTRPETRPRTVPAMIAAVVRDTPERTGLLVPGESTGLDAVTYAALLDRIVAAQTVLGRVNVAPGDRVGLLADDRAVWGQCYLGVIWNGRVAVPLDPQLKTGELRAILRESGARAIIVDAAHRGLIDAIKPDLPELSVVLSPQEVIADRGPHADASGDHRVPRAEGNELASLIFTSGTTGKPKGVMLTHWNLASNVQGVQDIGLCSPADRFLSVLPIHHAFECTAGFLNPLSMGGSVAFARGLSSADIVGGLRDSRATIMLGVPLLFEKVALAIRRKLRDLPTPRRAIALGMLAVSRSARRHGITAPARVFFRSLREKAALDSLKYVISGGAALPPWVAEFFDAIGVPIMQGYGLTETSPVLSVNLPTDYQHSSVGPPLPTAEMRIDNPNEQGIGEICARGPMVMAGYYNDEDETREVLSPDGWFRTGDLGWRAADGHFHVSGRAKNVIVTAAGKNIHPEEIEAALNGSPYILESMVYPSVRDGKSGESPAAIVVPDLDYIRAESPALVDDTDGLRGLITDKVKSICDNLAAYKRVGDIMIVQEELEKTTTRKIKRTEVLATYVTRS